MLTFAARKTKMVAVSDFYLHEVCLEDLDSDILRSLQFLERIKVVKLWLKDA